MVSFGLSCNTGAIDAKMDGSVLEENSSFKMVRLTFCSKLDWGSYIVSVAKTACQKIKPKFFLLFLSPEFALYFCKSTIQPCMEYCCYDSAVVPSCYFELLGKLRKWICRSFRPSIAASLEHLTHHQNVASVSLFYRYYFGRCSSELAHPVLLSYFRGRSSSYSDRLHDFSVTILRCFNDVYVKGNF